MNSPNVMLSNSRLKPILLHVGCGQSAPERLPSIFKDWQEIRLDVDARVKPDLVSSTTDLSKIPDASVDAIWSSHNLEHLESFEVPQALSEWSRVLQPGGFAYMTLPDLAQVAKLVAEGVLDQPVYNSPAGPIAPLDILFGHRASIKNGNPYMAHRTGFNSQTLGNALLAAGFFEVDVWSTRLTLWAVAYKDADAAARYRNYLIPNAINR